MTYSIAEIATIIGAGFAGGNHPDSGISLLLIDSRKIVFPEQSLFFAITGPRRDGHQFVPEVYARGVRNFVVKQGFDRALFPEGNFLLVADALQALQQLAMHHRGRFNIPVIGITGSNGKTIVKEWLYQLLREDYRIVRSPRSYNSQIGVPLSVWQMNQTHTLAIFEAGISAVGEMEKLVAVIQPTLTVFTSLGNAHDEGFTGELQKATEKAKLAAGAATVVLNKDPVDLLLQQDSTALFPGRTLFSWSRQPGTTVLVEKETVHNEQTIATIRYRSLAYTVTLPFTDRISVDNAFTCVSVLLALGYDAEKINRRLQYLERVDMRMQLKQGINNCHVLNDSYSNDLVSLELALDYLQQQAGAQKTTVILSDILQSGQDEKELYGRLAQQLSARKIGRLIGIGPAMVRNTDLLTIPGVTNSFFASTEDFFHRVTQQQFRDEYILLKGARVFAFERISGWLEQKVHQTVMEINLSAMVQNLKTYQQHLQPSTKLMAMVKAFSYGSGSDEVAGILQFHKVDYLAVAYADEGVELRKAGISLPIMVMNADEAGFDSLVSYDLEPEIYSFSIYTAFHTYLGQQGITGFPVHIKFNTGMNRLGFETPEATQLGERLQADKTMAVRSVFSHLVASEAAEHDAFTQRQVALYLNACDLLQQQLGYGFIRHIANTGAIFRHPQYQFDMVRLGIGLYGVDSAEQKDITLETVTTLKSTIAQIRKVSRGESVGYSRKGIVTRDSLIATVRIGYADGFSRSLGNGAGKMLVNGKTAPVIGNVCMDMTMIDITGLEGVQEGDVVEIFGKNLPVQQVAQWAGTIAYEILTGISQRVKRVYLEE
ncbi:bifunctional UDP-N-acetylmuramoyl-tripeptide:D-alanyl-D-alanine ligase/alanine racemase [Sediminibacterium soli]|uniref:bifunctional UDP-N-acetylmuramoyl-tripeptide:D-alanyl-D-alanine ligase/alanine racemase n=1 Tax=Sediminibacterium soli TaxID=2698829 RepID=UPI00137B6620|nr:bifunctional UDP-N-acetylmuramoyl-tripeptide:D-alanyl-D-alanine ligase/alanine racemase [Sediminibacterium soli]NCI47340.1 bifunctional UDP-N-acetylmuramoyl-tripeptide:D-alanyl-D-alanine ligase/alanine racemase [Sediminibacterium soli]